MHLVKGEVRRNAQNPSNYRVLAARPGAMEQVTGGMVVAILRIAITSCVTGIVTGIGLNVGKVECL